MSCMIAQFDIHRPELLTGAQATTGSYGNAAGGMKSSELNKIKLVDVFDKTVTL